ncbi:MAG: hypothetical protein C0469_11235 [Cyanobacteria bacterium DS2.3.42]|nr:hypothetical protein [Cyanobacteria bacterium DS2.3.42]
MAAPVKQILNDRYELIDCVGRGAMGFVYKATDQTNGEIVALKIMRPELARNELAVKRLMREVAVVSSLSNTHLGQVHGYGQEKSGAPYLVMEFVEGLNLAEVIKNGGVLKAERAIEIFTQICSGLMCAHANGIIHRDLKPSNVIVQHMQSGKDRAVIVDFGFARILRDATDTVRLTQEGEAFGSPAYMSPEQCLGEELDVRSDIYSLGCLMYETLTGSPPLVGDNVLATVAKQVRETPVSMRSHDSTIPEEIDDIVLKCLSKEPVLRYQKTSDLRTDLEKITQGGYVVSSAKRARKPAKVEKQSGDSLALRNTESSYRKIASLVAVVLLVAVLVGGITGGVVWYVMQKQVGVENTAKIPSSSAVRVEPITRSNAVEKPPASVPRNSELQPALKQSGVPHGSTLPSSKASAHKPTASTVTHEKRSSHADVAKRHSASSVRKSEPVITTNSSGWAQLKELRTHR